MPDAVLSGFDSRSLQVVCQWLWIKASAKYLTFTFDAGVHNGQAEVPSVQYEVILYCVVCSSLRGIECQRFWS